MMPPERAYIDTRGGRLAYCRRGGGPPIVLIHGSLVTADDMRLSLMDELSERYDVVAFDRPGHGESNQTPTDAGSPFAQAAMLADGWTALGLDHPVVVGHSFGGTVALCAAIDHPDRVASVVALAPLCYAEPRLEQLLLGPRALPLVGDLISYGWGRAADAGTLPLLRHAMFLPQAMPDVIARSYPFAWSSTADAMKADGRDSLGALRDLMRSAASYRIAGCRRPFFAGPTTWSSPMQFREQLRRG